MAKPSRLDVSPGGGGGGARRMSTGKMKKLAEPSKAYDPPVKGSGKPKYQNVIKSERVDTKAPRKDPIANASKVLKSLGKKTSKQEITRKAGKSKNIAKEIDRENKVTKGVRTEKPKTPKVPVKKKAPTKRNLPSDI
jgi:hypothetical protein